MQELITRDSGKFFNQQEVVQKDVGAIEIAESGIPPAIMPDEGGAGCQFHHPSAAEPAKLYEDMDAFSVVGNSKDRRR